MINEVAALINSNLNIFDVVSALRGYGKPYRTGYVDNIANKNTLTLPIVVNGVDKLLYVDYMIPIDSAGHPVSQFVDTTREITNIRIDDRS